MLAKFKIVEGWWKAGYWLLVTGCWLLELFNLGASGRGKVRWLYCWNVILFGVWGLALGFFSVSQQRHSHGFVRLLRTLCFGSLYATSLAGDVAAKSATIITGESDKETSKQVWYCLLNGHS